MKVSSDCFQYLSPISVWRRANVIVSISFMKFFHLIYHVRFPIVTIVPLTPFCKYFSCPPMFHLLCFVLASSFLISNIWMEFCFCLEGHHGVYSYFFLLFLFIYFIHLFSDILIPCSLNQLSYRYNYRHNRIYHPQYELRGNYTFYINL